MSKCGTPRKDKKVSVSMSHSYNEDDDIDAMLLENSHRSTPSESKKKFVPLQSFNNEGEEEEDNDYMDEAFEGDEETPYETQMSSPIIIPSNSECDETRKIAEIAESHEREPENSVDGMTLEDYLAEYAKKKEAKRLEMLDDDELINANGGEHTPEATDPTGLDGVSPLPGQSRIAGYGTSADSGDGDKNRFSPILKPNTHQSPFQQSKEVPFVPIYDPLENNSNTEHPTDKTLNATLLTMMKKMADVENQLHELKSTGKGPPKVQFNMSTPPASPQKSARGYSQPSSGLSSGAKAQIAANTTIIGTKKGSTKTKMKVSSTLVDDLDYDDKLEALMKETKKRGDALVASNEKIENMHEKMIEMVQHIKHMEGELDEQRTKTNKAIKGKKKVEKALEDLQIDLKHYNELIQAVENLRLNEDALLRKIDELNDANRSLSMQLKHSLAREMEWRTLHHHDNQHGENIPTSTKLPSRQERLHSHRSMPEYDVEQEKALKEKRRKSHLNRRTADNSLPKLRR